MQVPDRWWKKFKNKELSMHHRDGSKEKPLHLLCALAMCENIDWNVGRILKKLDQLDVAEDTIVATFVTTPEWHAGMVTCVVVRALLMKAVCVHLLIRWPSQIPKGLEIETFFSYRPSSHFFYIVRFKGRWFEAIGWPRYFSASFR